MTYDYYVKWFDRLDFTYKSPNVRFTDATGSPKGLGFFELDMALGRMQTWTGASNVRSLRLYDKDENILAEWSRPFPEIFKYTKEVKMVNNEPRAKAEITISNSDTLSIVANWVEETYGVTVDRSKARIDGGHLKFETVLQKKSVVEI